MFAADRSQRQAGRYTVAGDVLRTVAGVTIETSDVACGVRHEKPTEVAGPVWGPAGPNCQADQ